MDEARPLRTGVGLATGITASAGGVGVMIGGAASTCITEGEADGWTRGGKDSLSDTEVGAGPPWVVETGTSTADLVGVMLPSFALVGGVEEYDTKLT